MRETDPMERRRRMEVLGGRLLLMLFGLGVLGFLVVADRADWLEIRPTTDTPLVLTKAADRTTVAHTGAGIGKSIATP